MRVISRSRLRDFWQSRQDGAERAKAERALSAWYKVADQANCSNWAELKQVFGSIDRVGDCVVFDVKGNDYRLIGRLRFDRQILYVLEVMDHAEYDRKDRSGQQQWIKRCGCFDPPPSRR